MSSGRRYSVERHINTLHGGSGVAVPFEEYVMGIRNGIYTPKQMSRHARFQKVPKFIEIIDEELTKKAVQMAISGLEKNSAEKQAIENFIRLKIQSYVKATRQQAYNSLVGFTVMY